MVGALHLVLGLTGSGKTSFVLQSAMAAARSGMRVYIVSGEMTGAELLPRLLGDRLVQYVDDAGTPITVERVVRGDPQALPVFEAAAAEAEQELARIIVDDRSWPTVTHVLAAVRRQHAVSQLHAVYVDYLQLVQAPAGPSRPREQQVREIAESMKQLARELGIAVVVTAQLVDPPAWASEQDQPQRTGAPAVRESRAAAHAADLVVELARPSRADSRFVPYTLRVLKARHSAADSTSEMLLYDRWSCRFERAPEGMRVEY
jgi:replicative DNA helicase